MDRHIQHWDASEEHAPRRQDALRTLLLCLGLLADSLPIVLRFIGQASPQEQLEFWRAFIALDRDTDFSLNGINLGMQRINDFHDTTQEIICWLLDQESHE